MLKLLLITLALLGTYPAVKRDARISRKEMEKSLVFVRKDASQCRHDLKDFRSRVLELYKGKNRRN